MKLTTIKEIFRNREEYLDKKVTVGGWVRSVRGSKVFGFIVLHDGTFFETLQIVYHDTLENFAEIGKLNVGAAIIVEGTLVATPDAKQPFEIQADSVTVEGQSLPEYPLQKKRHSLEYLRTITHLRPRTNTFQAVFRVRSLCAYAIHKFFQERGFVYVHTPLITASDAEGAGEMFQVTTLNIGDPARDGEFRIGIKCVEGIHAELTVYRAENGRYQEVLQCPAVIGMNGPCKQASGDNRTPLGTWTVGAAFGIKEDPGSVIPYTQVTEDHYWRGDGGSPKYNTMVRRSEFPDEDYSDDEHIIEYGSVYNYILDMGFNKPCAPYVGSALFLHCWRGPNQGTHGCVAVAEENMVKILQTITPGTSITIY